MSNLYGSLKEIRENLEYSASDTSDDSLLTRLLEVASREIDRFCNRHFFVKTQTKTFNPPEGNSLVIPDLLSVSSVVFDTDRDSVFDDETWTEGTHFFLAPLDTFPKTEITRISWSTAVWPSDPRSIQISGGWGYGDGESASPVEAISETWTLAAVDTETLTVSDGTDYSVGETYLVGTEQIYISAISTNDLTLKRGQNGTTAATHSGATASKFLYPLAVKQYCLELATLFLNDREDVSKQSERIGDYSYNRYPNSEKRIKMVLGSYKRNPWRGVNHGL